MGKGSLQLVELLSYCRRSPHTILNPRGQRSSFAGVAVKQIMPLALYRYVNEAGVVRRCEADPPQDLLL